MRVKNTTTIDTELLRSVLAFVCPSGVAGFDVRLNNSPRGTYSGRAYAEGASCHDRACPFVILKVGAASRFPLRGDRSKTPTKRGYLPAPWLASREEALVFLAAHELRHLWQARVPRGRRVWGSRGQYSERDADAYALQMLRAWRRAV